MNNFREKAREVKAAGVAERGNFEPTGVPKRMYNFWLNETNSKKGKAIRRGTRRENFCHFWRVVAIWAPLLFLGCLFLDLLDSPLFIGLVGLVLLGGFVTLFFVVNDFWIVVATILAIIFTALASVAVCAGLVFLQEKYWKDSWTPVFRKVCLTIAGILVVAAVAFGFYAWITATSATFVGLFLVVCVVFGLVLSFAGAKAANFISGKRAIAREKNRERTDAFLRGEITRAEYVGHNRREPNRFEKRMAAIFSGIADFIVLIAQVVRVNKWKICPLVEVDKNNG